ncbi:MAG: alpha/beta hydrolase family protein [Phycisphaerales bacterium JB040]
MHTVSALVAAALFVSPALAQDAPATPPSIADVRPFTFAPPMAWTGGITLPTGQELGMELHLEDFDGTPSLYFSVPAQGVNKFRLDAYTLEDGRLEFTVAFPGMPEAMYPSFDLGIGPDGTLAGTMTQSGMTFDATFEATTDEALAEAREAARPQTPKPPFPYRTEEVAVQVDGDEAGHTLAGTVTLPDAAEFGDGPYPAVVFITGSGAQDRDETLFDHKPFAVIADHLARRGIASLRCDDRGVFGSSGDPQTPTTLDFADDVRAQVAYLAARDDIDEIGLVGHSEGGLIAPIVAADSGDVDFAVLLAGTGVPGKEILIEQTAALLTAGGLPPAMVENAKGIQTELLEAYAAGAELESLRDKTAELIRAQSMVPIDDETMRTLVDGALAPFRSNWMRTFVTLDPRPYLAQVTQPVLVLNGSLDLQVLADQNIPEIREALADNPDVTVTVFENLNHLFQRATTGAISEYATITTTIEPEVLEAIADWIEARTDDE